MMTLPVASMMILLAEELISTWSGRYSAGLPEPEIVEMHMKMIRPKQSSSQSSSGARNVQICSVELETADEPRGAGFAVEHGPRRTT